MFLYLLRIIIPILHPLIIISKDKTRFFIWVSFTIVAGQLGVLINFLSELYVDIEPCETPQTLAEIIRNITESGDLYTYSIALIASMVGSVFTELVSDKKHLFKKFYINTTIIGSFLLLVIAVIYSLKNYSGESQFWFYGISIIVAIYFYSILQLSSYPNEFDDCQDGYGENEDNEMNTLIKKTASIDSIDGIKL